MEPEPLGWFETTVETLRFLEELFDRAKDPEMVRRRIGINYDCCHLAIEREDAREGLDAIKQARSSAEQIAPELCPAGYANLRKPKHLACFCGTRLSPPSDHQPKGSDT